MTSRDIFENRLKPTFKTNNDSGFLSKMGSWSHMFWNEHHPGQDTGPRPQAGVIPQKQLKHERIKEETHFSKDL